MRVVALGGGHGLAASLRAIRNYADEISAIVSVADDGGSSGVLRNLLGVAPPGDLRKCLVALAPDDSLWKEALEYRFTDDHPLGNLLIVGLTQVGNLQRALDEIGKMIGAAGRVLAATAQPVVLCAVTTSGIVRGQVEIGKHRDISRVFIEPVHAEVDSLVTDAILSADQLVIGPGSLFTSVLAVMSIPDVSQAYKSSNAHKIFVCNLRPQINETSDFDLGRHLRALGEHGVEVDTVLWDPSEMPLGSPAGPQVIQCDLAGCGGLHDSDRLARYLCDLV